MARQLKSVRADPAWSGGELTAEKEQSRLMRRAGSRFDNHFRVSL
jgi:hypothetical protein